MRNFVKEVNRKRRFIILLLLVIVVLSACLYVSCNKSKVESFISGILDKFSSGGTATCEHSQLKTLEGREATCTESGLTEGKACALCGEIIEDQTVIAIKPHAFDGADDKICNMCGGFYGGQPTFVMSEARVSAGGTAEVSLVLKNNPGIASIVLAAQYDDSVLQLTKIEYNSQIGGQTVMPKELKSPLTLYWINGFANATGDWTFATLYFNVAAGASGEYDVQISYNADNVYNLAEENLDFEVVNGKIIIE